MPFLKITYNETDESWLTEGDSELAVPFLLSFEDEKAHIDFYPAAKEIVDEYIHLFGGEESTLLSSDAVKWLCGSFDEFLAGYGFELSPDSEACYIKYTIPNPSVADHPSVVRLPGGEGYTDLTETDIEGLLSDGYIIYAAVLDGKIAAVANTGEPVDEEAPYDIEIGVDTAEDYRGMGLGKACAAALARELISRGHSVTYECASDNAASRGLVKSLGGAAVSKKIYIVGFRGE